MVVFYFGHPLPGPLMNNWRLTLIGLGVFTTLLTVHFPAQAQPGAGGCLVSEFRSIALLTHDVAERILKVTAWLSQKGPRCTEAQLSTIASNRATWLGTADTIGVAGSMDGLIEAKIANDPERMASLFNSKGKETRASVEVTKPPPAPAPVVAAAAAPVSNTVLPVVVPAPIPEKPEVPDAFLGERQRTLIFEFYEETRGPGECPRGMVKRGDKCEARFKERDWKLRQPLASSEKPEDLPMPLLLKLGQPAREHQFKRVGFDILLLKGPKNIVTDAVLDLGGLKAKEDKK